jgi:hypothetical protein
MGLPLDSLLNRAAIGGEWAVAARETRTDLISQLHGQRKSMSPALLAGLTINDKSPEAFYEIGSMFFVRLLLA